MFYPILLLLLIYILWEQREGGSLNPETYAKPRKEAAKVMHDAMIKAISFQEYLFKSQTRQG